jgi:predicted nucleotidyltransferase
VGSRCPVGTEDGSTVGGYCPAQRDDRESRDRASSNGGEALGGAGGRFGYDTHMAAVVTKQEILRRVQTRREAIRSLGVERLGLFGSFVRGGARPAERCRSPRAIPAEEKTFDNFMELAFLLEDLLQRRVELVTTEGLSPYLGPHILEEVQDVALDA